MNENRQSNQPATPLKIRQEPKINIIPLGGCGEIGKNMTVIECGEDIILIDAGLMFPEEDMLGVDIIIPDFSYILRKKKNIKAIILTHGHEDHIGALPYLLAKVNAPVYGTKLTIGLVKNKLEEFTHLLKIRPRLNTINPEKDILRFGVFKIEPFRVCHSIVDGIGLAITTPVGLIIHTGDFKIDHTPVDGRKMDLHKIAEFGNRGVALLMSDSTNVESRGYTLSEKVVGETLKEVFGAAKGRIIVATFSSSVSRLKQVIDTAILYNRKVVITGMSMANVIRISRELGYLNVAESVFVSLNQVGKLPPQKTVIITTGSQGEPMSALSRMADSTHKQIRIKKGDTVIISARVIPGNENAISRNINNLFKLGAEVVYEKVSEIHVSGHASQEELKLILNMARPRYFMPVHGEHRHLVHHAVLAQKVCVARGNAFVVTNGSKLTITRQRASIGGQVHAGITMVDGKGVGDIGTTVLRDRQHLSQGGMVMIIVILNKQTGELLSEPEIVSRGFVYMRRSDELIVTTKKKILSVLKEFGRKKAVDQMAIKEALRSTLKSFFYKETARRPMILPVVLEI